MVHAKRLCLALVAVASLALPAAAVAESGDISFDSCLANGPAEGCTDLPFDPIEFAAGVAVSPDGKSVYVVSESSDSIAHFFRDRASGRLAYDGCLNNDGSTGCGDLPGAPLASASGVAVSPDGKSVYVTGWGSDTVAHFFRSGPDGQIAYDGCLGNDGSNGCADMPGAPFNGPRGVTVSPDGKSVYVASYANGSLTHLLRSGPDGQIVFDSCVQNYGTQSCIDVPGAPLSGARSVAVSPDGKSVYVASTISGAVSHLFRAGDTGKVAWDGCLSDTGSNNCANLPGEPLKGANAVAASPDGKSVYASGSSAVAHFFRSGPDGQIAYDGCLNNNGSESCADVPGTPFGTSWGIAASADGRSVYVASSERASVAHMLRSGPDGQIVWDGCLANSTSGGCGDIPFAPMNGANAVAVSPDGKSVYVVSNLTDSITHFAREPVPAPPPSSDPGDEPGEPGEPGPGGPGPGSTPDTLAPSISGLVARGGRGFRYTLSEPATVTVAIERARPGRRVGRRCAKASRQLRSRPVCTRYSRLAPTLTRTGAAGPNELPLHGRLGTKRLAPGAYRATFVATDAAGNRSPGAQVRFRVRARRGR